jgi:DNA-binding CsgD family transcriptional regulator
VPSIYTVQEYVRKLDVLSNHEEQLYTMLEIYLKLFPTKDAALFRYSPLGYLAEGIILLSPTGLLHIRERREDIRSLHIVHTAIRERKAKYCSGIELLKQTSSKYVLPSDVNSLLIVPICYGTNVIGFICSSEFTKDVAFSKELLSSVTLYGKLVGKFIEDSTGEQSSVSLSKRELETMKRIAWGENTKEMADSMGISELTVKQYVQSATRKLGANNRSHAVGELYRRGIISL